MKIDHLKTFEPLTENQAIFFQDFKQSKYEAFVLHGWPGVGKTFLAVYKALELVLDKGNPYKQIVLIRSSVQTRDQGHLPGDAAEKMAQFESPYVSMVKKMFETGVGGGKPYERLKEQGALDFCSTSFLRGETFEDCVVIFDEAQSATQHEIETVLTRFGRNCKMIICGDTAQNDLKKEKSGLCNVMDILYEMGNVSFIEFDVEDIVRSGFVASFIKMKIKMGK